MHKIKILFFTIISFLLLFDNTKQSHVRQAIMTVKAIGDTIKSPIVKTFGNTIKSSVSMFRQNKNTIKNIACGLQEKYLKTSTNFGSKSVKYLKEEGIKKIKHMVPYVNRGGNQLFRTPGKKSIYIGSAEQIARKELGSLINIVSKNRPQLAFFFVAGSLNKLTRLNFLTTEEDDIELKNIETVQQSNLRSKKTAAEHNSEVFPSKDKMEEHFKAYIEEQIEPYKVLEKKTESQKKYNLKNKEKISEQKRKYYQDNKEKINERKRIYYFENKEKVGVHMKKYYFNNKEKLLEKQGEYYTINKEKLVVQNREYRLVNKDKIAEQRRENYKKNKDKYAERYKAYNLKNKDKISEKKKEYYQNNKDIITEKRKEYIIRKKAIKREIVLKSRKKFLDLLKSINFEKLKKRLVKE